MSETKERTCQKIGCDTKLYRDYENYCYTCEEKRKRKRIQRHCPECDAKMTKRVSKGGEYVCTYCQELKKLRDENFKLKQEITKLKADNWSTSQSLYAARDHAQFLSEICH